MATASSPSSSAGSLSAPVVQADRALQKAFQKSVAVLLKDAGGGVDSFFPSVAGASSSSSSSSGSSGGDSTAKHINAHFQICCQTVLANSRAELQQIFAEKQTVVVPAAAAAVAANGMDIDSEASGGAGDDSSASDTPKKKGGRKSSTKSKSPKPKSKAAAAAAAAAAAEADAPAAAPASATTRQVTINEQLARLAALTAQQPKLADGSAMPLLNTSSDIEQQLRDTVADAKLVRRSELKQQLDRLQTETATLTRAVMLKRAAVQAATQSHAAELAQLTKAVEACNMWKPP